MYMYLLVCINYSVMYTVMYVGVTTTHVPHMAQHCAPHMATKIALAELYSTLLPCSQAPLIFSTCTRKEGEPGTRNHVSDIASRSVVKG